jgi:hypothetical protein
MAAGKAGRRRAGPGARPGDVHELGALVPDAENRRRRTPHGARMLIESLEKVGAARGIVIDEDNVIRAGNGIVEAALAAGLTRVHVVEGDGQTLIAVRRRGLSPEQKRELAMYDNRTGELAEWNAEQLAADQAAGKPLEAWFDERKRHKLTADRDAAVSEVPVDDVGDRFWIAIRGPLKSQAVALQRLQTALADVDGVDVELGTVQPTPGWNG